MKPEETITSPVSLDTNWITVLEDTVILDLGVNYIGGDRTQYKPYSPGYDTHGILVRVSVPRSLVWEIKEAPYQSIVLSPEALAIIADQLASPFDVMHRKFLDRPRVYPGE